MLIFTYGTLMSGTPNHGVMQEPVFKGIATTVNDYSLYAHGVPYASKKPKYTIVGELYEVDTADKNRIDRLENHPMSWAREKVEIVNDKGEKVIAWMYFNENIPLNAVEIPSGNYRNYINDLYKNKV